MNCPNCNAYVVDTLEVALEPIWKGGWACRYRQTWRLFPCGHRLVAEDSLLL